MANLKRIILTPGEPAGIGPDITLDMAQEAWPFDILAVADPHLLSERANQLHLPIQIIEANLADAPTTHQAGTLKVLPVRLNKQAKAGELNPDNATYVLDSLKQAAQLCLDGNADALVTGPVHKQLMNEAGIPFSGHTEFFADYCQVPHTLMLFVIDEIKVALVTTHLPLADVAHAITQDKILQSLTTLRQGLNTHFDIKEPRILVCGLNPHAGEGGHLGREEIEIITPALNQLRKQYDQIIGPLPADTLFTPSSLKGADAVLAMYHDQALPLIKHIGFDRAVNVTLGLPFIRTSVDHGTALDIAGTGCANAGSLCAALRLAADIGSH